MIKLHNNKIKDNSDSSPKISRINSKNNEHSFLENELSIMIKKKREEYNIQKQKIRIQKIVLDKLKSNHKEELSKYKKLIQNILTNEKEIEKIEKNISKIKRQKIYNKSLIMKFRNLFKPCDVNQKYLFLLNSDWCGEKIKSEFLENIIGDEEEFFYYLNYLERYYINLEKENKNNFNQFKIVINDYLKNDNWIYPFNILLLYLENIIKEIIFSNTLKEKYDELKEIESRKNSVDKRIRTLELNKSEKETLLNEMKNYIELIKEIIQQFVYYQNLYKKKSISKESLSKKLKKIQSINLQQWNPENKNKNDNDINNNKSKFLSYENREKNKSAIFTINISDNLKTQQNYESKSQNNSRNISADYLSKTEGPLCKKTTLEKFDNSYNDLVISMSNTDSDKENISENNENESPVSRINITALKKNTINVYKKKLSVKCIKNIPNCGFNNNDFNSITQSNKTNNNSNTNTNSKTLYNKKKSNSLNHLNYNIVKENKNNLTYRNNVEMKDSLECETVTKNTQRVNNNVFILSNKDIRNNNNQKNLFIKDKKKGLYFIKKVKKNNKKFVIDKDKLFNKKLPKKLDASNYNKNKNLLNDIIKIKKKDNLIKNIKNETKVKKEKQSLSQNNRIYFVDDIKNGNSKVKNIYEYKDKKWNENGVNPNKNNDIKNIFYDMYSKKCNDSINTIKNEMKKRNFLSINKTSTRRGMNKKNEIKTELKNDSCCISCT